MEAAGISAMRLLPSLPNPTAANRQFLSSRHQTEQQPSGVFVPECVKRMNNHFLKETRAHVDYVYHRKTGRFFIQLINDQTSEVIREIPPKRVLDMYAAMAERFGMYVDAKG